MNKSLAWFLVFLLGLVLAAVVTAVVLGPNVLRFVFHDERDTAPFVMIELLDFGGSESLDAYLTDYAVPFIEEVEARGGAVKWTGTTGRVLSGSLNDAWPWLVLIDYPSRAGFVELATSAKYRRLGDIKDMHVRRSVMLAATPRMPFESRPFAHYVFRWLEFRSDGEREDYLHGGHDLTQHAADYGGAKVWEASLNPLSATDENAWQHLVVLGFDDAGALERWAEDPARQTAAVLEKHYFAREAMIVTRPVQMLP